MWIEEITLKNIKCFQSQTIKLGEKGKPYPWVTFLGENGTGKTTVLQAIGLLLLGRQGISRIGFWPEGWGRAQRKSAVHENIAIALNLSKKNFLKGTEVYDNLGQSPITLEVDFNIRKSDLWFDASPQSKLGQSQISLLESDYASALRSMGQFSAGYGAFRRLSKGGAFGSKRPDFIEQENFKALFNEDFPIETFESWLMYLDHIILKNNDPLDKKHLAITKSAINALLPEGNTIQGADIDGKVYFITPQGRIPTSALSDGFRSILALAGDLIWRMIQAFPESDAPLEEHGVVVIDEIDIHLHPKWQRSIAGLLQKTFPYIQFIVATHSPIVAAGAGSDAVTYGFYQEGAQTKVERIDHVWAQSVDDILKSRAFGLVSEFSEETQAQIDTYQKLRGKKKRSREDEKKYQAAIPFVREALGPSMGPSDIQLEIEALLKEKFG